MCECCPLSPHSSTPTALSKGPVGARTQRGPLEDRFQPRPRRSASNHETFRGRQSCGDEIHSLTWPRRALHSCGGIVQVEEKSGKMSLERERRTHPSGSGTTQGGQAQCCARSGLAGVCRDSGECGAAEAWGERKKLTAPTFPEESPTSVLRGPDRA